MYNNNLDRNDRNSSVINEYYSKYYSIEYDAVRNADCYKEIKLEFYNGDEIKYNWFKKKEGEEYFSQYDLLLMCYELELPFHDAVLDKLVFSKDNNSSFIYLLFDRTISDINETEGFAFLERLLYSYSFDTIINLVYSYETIITKIVDNEGKILISTELLVNIDNDKLDLFIEELKNNKEIKKRSIKYMLVNINNPLSFFKREYFLEKYKYTEYQFVHLRHCFVIFALKEGIEDYCILGDHISKCIKKRDDMADSINNLMVYHYAIDIVEEKIKKYSEVKNKYLKNTYNEFVVSLSLEEEELRNIKNEKPM
jgi:hypothetical protein